MNISEPLISWYMRFGRQLPWRETSDPYCIWLSEIILQQTRVEQGLQYYLRFINTYPTLGLLAGADTQEILKLWQGLGYYSRARNLHGTAKYIHNELDSHFPDRYETLVKLKGVGPYTAAAIASFAYGLPHAVVDGNVARVIARIFDIALPVNASEGGRLIQSLADAHLDKRNPGIYNQAIMELGALVCTPKSPNCKECPLRARCMACERNTQLDRPVKLKKSKQRLRHIHYAVVESNDSLLFRKREDKDIWQGLNDFASIEYVENVTPPDLAAHLLRIFPAIRLALLPGHPEFECVHQLTHQRIEAKFWRFKIDGDIPPDSLYLSVKKNALDTIAVPRLVHKYLQAAKWLS